MSASLPDRPIHFDVQRQIVIESSSSEEEVEPRFEWDITKSVFGPRKSQAECRAYFDHGTQAERRAFDIDWRRVYEKSRVQRLFQRESGGDEDAWRSVKKVLWKHFPSLYDVFDYYATIGDGDCFSIQVWRGRASCAAPVSALRGRERVRGHPHVVFSRRPPSHSPAFELPDERVGRLHDAGGAGGRVA